MSVEITLTLVEAVP